jgi:hypothetical protein
VIGKAKKAFAADLRRKAQIGLRNRNIVVQNCTELDRDSTTIAP